MWYNDELYGGFSLPSLVESLKKAPEFQRLSDISMDTLPREVVPYGTADRSGHSLGVVRLALDVIEKNSGYLSSLQERLLLAGSLLHDAGSPPFSHLTEPFLLKMNGMNGESFLGDILVGSETAAMMWKAFGLEASDVVAMVTGDYRPFSDILHGSIDIDNIDNVLRYQYASTGQRSFDARAIASSYRFRRGRWEFSMDCLDEVRKWQAARRAVYAIIYGTPHIVLASMAYRAVECMFLCGDIPLEFFHFTDREAFEFLSTNDDARYLIDAVRIRQWYEEVVSVETVTPREELKALARKWNARGIIVEGIVAQAGIPPWAVCGYCAKGRDIRKIAIPFVDDYNREYWDDVNDDPIYRLKVFVHPEYANHPKLLECVRSVQNGFSPVRI